MFKITSMLKYALICFVASFVIVSIYFFSPIRFSDETNMEMEFSDRYFELKEKMENEDGLSEEEYNELQKEIKKAEELTLIKIRSGY